MELEFSKQEIISAKVSKILSNSFNGPKSEIRFFKDRINFACPYCGDSNDSHKKRGNIYWKTLMFHCYNGGCEKKHSNVVDFLKDNGESISQKDDLIFFLEYIKRNQVAVSTKNYMELGIFQKMKEYSIPIEEVKQKFNLIEVNQNLKIERYLKGRFMHGKMHNFLYDPKEEQLYIFNLSPSLKETYGWQIRNFRPKREKYISYTLEKINNIVREKSIDLPNDELIKLNTLSIYFNIALVDFSKPVVVFEGPMDSILCSNSIAISGVDKPTEMFDEISTIRYLFDNDVPGRRKMEYKLKSKKFVFMWNKLAKDFKIQEKVKDFNDLIKYCWVHKNDAIRHYSEYFTNNPLDLRSI
jgi:hypothetical protein